MTQIPIIDHLVSQLENIKELDPTDMGFLMLPLIAFCALVYFGRDELGVKGILIWLAGVAAAGICIVILMIPLSLLVVFLCVADIALVLIIFGGDIQIT